MASGEAINGTEAMRPSTTHFNKPPPRRLGFRATGDGGPSSCSADSLTGTQTEYNEASLSVSGWTETRSTLPSVERISGSTSITPTRGEPPEHLWSPDEYSSYGSALQYVPEYTLGRFLRQRPDLRNRPQHIHKPMASSGTCNTSPFNALARTWLRAPPAEARAIVRREPGAWMRVPTACQTHSVQGYAKTFLAVGFLADSGSSWYTGTLGRRARYS